MPEDIGKFPGNLNEESLKKIDSAASVQLVFCSSFKKHPQRRVFRNEN